MTRHQSHRPIPARRLYVEPRMGYSDAYIEQRDQEAEDRANSPREPKSCDCLGRGCPACWGDEPEYIEEDEDQ